MKNRRATTGMFTIPLFIISMMIFILMAVGVIQDIPFLKFVDSHSLDWFTTTFGTPQRQFEGDMLNYYMTFCATIGDVSGVIVMSVIITIILLFKYRRLAIWFICTILSGTLINILIKMTIERMRPYNHLAIDSGFSFPSGHSNASTLFFITLLIVVMPLIKRAVFKAILSGLALILWISVLICRLYFHAHYLTDVVGGVTLGLTWIALWLMVYPLFERIKFKKNKHVIH